ncbi:MAG: alpha/beta hydrolase [Betaproteobacteria bacterium]
MQNFPGAVSFAIGLIVSSAVLAACSESATPAPTLALKPCRIANVDSEVKCATLDVFENRQTRQGRRIGLNIVVLPATARIKESDPVFLFAGGPGQAATDLAKEALMILGGLNAKRDIVLIDQRGTGKSNGLACKFGDSDRPEMVDPVKRDHLSRALLRACRDKLSERADLTLYTTTIAMADIDDVRAALGYQRINLWGGSYGTRTALEYLRRYPQQVRSVVLDGVVPPTLAMPVTFSRDATAAYEKMIGACAAEPACAKRFPDLKAQVDELLTALDRQPRKVLLPDALTGVVRERAVTRDGVLAALFSSLYVPEMAALLPESLARAKQGDFAPLLAMSSTFGDFAEEKIFAGMRFSVVCAEDIPRINGASSPPAPAPFGGMFVREFVKACGEWPRGAMAKDFDQPVQSDKPVLILSGGLDPVTPPRFGDEVKKSLANAAHLVAQNVGHGVSVRGCAPRLIKKFVEAASVAGLDGKCLERLPRPIFFEPMRARDESNNVSPEKDSPKRVMEGAAK